MGLVFWQSYLLEDVAYQKTVVAKKDINRNTIITKDNVGEYFAIKEVNIMDVTEGALDDISKLIEKKTIVPLYSGEVATLKDFENISVYTSGFENPVEVSIEISNIANANGGKIRAGDVVNITMMFTKEQLGLTNSASSVVVKDENGNAEQQSYRYSSHSQYVMKNLYVKRVLDSSGVEIKNDDSKSSASILIFEIEADEEIELNNALTNCSTLRVSKVLSKKDGVLVDMNIE